MPSKPSLDAKMCSTECFKINIGLCRYKGTETVKSLVFWDQSDGQPSGCLQRPLPLLPLLLQHSQMSVFILSRELSIFVRVFLMRNAVNLADGFWYQHSFMSLAMEVKVWNLIRRERKKKKSIIVSFVNIQTTLQCLSLLDVERKRAWIVY